MDHSHSSSGEPRSAQPIAHVTQDLTRLHVLVDHLQCVANRAEAGAADFDSAAWGRLAGLWHDLGKYSQAFQDKIHSESGLNAHIESPGRVDHSTAGALLARRAFANSGHPLACVIAGHHCGLSDFQADLLPRLDAKPHLLDLAIAGGAPPEILEVTRPSPPRFLTPVARTQADTLKRSGEFWIRMLYSALVDADFLDTEAFFEGTPRPSGRSVDSDLLQSFDAYMANKSRQVIERGLEHTKVNIARTSILRACIERADGSQGVFTLTAPTGGGKTLAAMAFALRHALRHQLRRIIVVIPFTSIIEQNARQYRDVFGDDAVIEHHSNLDPARETPANRIACENWDAPIIVTTSVQFLESLLANRSSRCRKLHNIVRSVVIFDEVQTLPPGQLAPILDVLKELIANYCVSLVLSTATQPALKERDQGMGKTFPGFPATQEIISEPLKLFAELRRVRVVWPQSLDEPVAWETVADEIRGEPQSVLAIVHRRDDARRLAELISGALHLSALMCAAHRSRVIAAIRQALKDKQVIKVVSTQLVEAGVDLDFPIVYRALGGLDSLAQAAGRCNREGSLDGMGVLRVFLAPTPPPRGTPQQALTASEVMLRADPHLDLQNPHVFEPYFRNLYAGHNPDALGVQAHRAAWNFRTVAESFQLIEDDGSEPVVVPYGDAEKRLGDLRRFGPSRERLRGLQPFIVTVYATQLAELEASGAVELIAEYIRAVKQDAGFYHERFGLIRLGS